MSRTLIRLALVAAAAVPLAFGSSRAGGLDVVDSGSFTIYLNGERVGEERFMIRADRGGDVGPIYRTRGQLNLKLENRTMRIAVAFEGIGARCRLRRYEVEINGSVATKIVAEGRGERIQLQVRSPGGEERKEFLFQDHTAVLDLHIAHHYFFALKVLGEGTRTPAQVLVPRQRSQEKATIEARGTATVQVSGRPMQLRHIAVTVADGTVHHIYARGDRVMKVEVPSLQFVAERSLDDLETGNS